MLPAGGASLVWGGDGHSHWHIRDLENYELDRLDNGSKVGTGRRAASASSTRPSSGSRFPVRRPRQVYTPGSVCGQNNAATSLRMGISVGWGDRYGSSLPDQYIDVTDLNSGNYRLLATADAGNRFAESDETNNTTWVDLKLTLNHKGKGSGGNKVNVSATDRPPNTGIRPTPSVGIQSKGRGSVKDAPPFAPTELSRT